MSIAARGALSAPSIAHHVASGTASSATREAAAMRALSAWRGLAVRDARKQWRRVPSGGRKSVVSFG